MSDDRTKQNSATETDQLARLNEAVFGDANGNKGMKEKVDDMYEIFTGASITGKLIKNVIITLGALAAAGYAIIRLIKGQSPF